jgi:hyperosmotically inducible protein
MPALVPIRAVARFINVEDGFIAQRSGEFGVRRRDGCTHFFPRVLRAAQTDRDLQRPFEEPLDDETRQPTHHRQVGDHRGELRSEFPDHVIRQPRVCQAAAPSTSSAMTAIFRDVHTSGVVKVDDSTLQSRIAARLKTSASLAPRDIDVDVNQGIVTLTGTVRTATEKTRAERLATVSGVTRVDNRIEVDPKIDQSKIEAAGEKTKAGVTKAVDATVNATKKTTEAVQKGVGKSEQGVGKAADKTSGAMGRVGDKMSDTSVTALVKAGFSGEKLLQDTAIDVDTTDHVVTLKGTVASNAAKARAEEIARSTDGVTGVVNQIVVSEQ